MFLARLKLFSQFTEAADYYDNVLQIRLDQYHTPDRASEPISTQPLQSTDQSASASGNSHCDQCAREQPHAALQHSLWGDGAGALARWRQGAVAGSARRRGGRRRRRAGCGGGLAAGPWPRSWPCPLRHCHCRGATVSRGARCGSAACRGAIRGRSRRGGPWRRGGAVRPARPARAEPRGRVGARQPAPAHPARGPPPRHRAGQDRLSAPPSCVRLSPTRSPRGQRPPASLTLGPRRPRRPPPQPSAIGPCLRLIAAGGRGAQSAGRAGVEAGKVRVQPWPSLGVQPRHAPSTCASACCRPARRKAYLAYLNTARSSFLLGMNVDLPLARLQPAVSAGTEVRIRVAASGGGGGGGGASRNRFVVSLPAPHRG